jgi:hypothetical protein
VYSSSQNHPYSIDSKSRPDPHPVKFRNCAERIADNSTNVFGIGQFEEPRGDRFSVPCMVGSLDIGNYKFALCVIERAELTPVQIRIRVPDENDIECGI